MIARVNHSSQRGFSLIEALIAFAVLSFGMMGVVTLLVTSKSSQFETVQRTRAVNLANSLVERVRINPSAATAYHTGLDSPRAVSPVAEPLSDCSSASCTTTELAAHDLWRWEQDLIGATAVDGDARNTGGLAQPRGCVVFTADSSGVRPNTGTLQVVVAWRGLVESTDAVPSGTACGAGSAGSDDYRRQIVVNTLIIDEADLANAIVPPPPS